MAGRTLRSASTLALALASLACGQAEAGAAGCPTRAVAHIKGPLKSLPAPAGRVVDRADLLPPAAERALGDKLRRLERETTDQLVVVSLPSLDGRTIAQIGLTLGNTWGIGRADKDNGVLLIVAPTERKVRIEVGYGLEGLLTDRRAADIIKRDLVPKFAAGDFPAGIDNGVDAIAAVLRSDKRRPACRAEVRTW